MISVVFSAINCSGTVRAAVLSTLKSLGRRGEVVFHLDPSSDDSLEILSGISDPRFRLLPTKENLGFAGGLNYAINESKHELVARMDADDICLPWRFERQIGQLHRQKVDGLFSTAIVFGKPVRPIGFFPQLPLNLDENYVATELTIRNPFVHPTLLIRKSALTAVGGYRPAVAEDYDLYLRLASEGVTLRRDWLPTVLYRIHETQATFNSSEWARQVAHDSLIHDSMLALFRILSLKTNLPSESQEPRGLVRFWLELERRGLSSIIDRTERKDEN